MIIDGRAIAEDLYVELSARRAKAKQSLKLGIVVCGANPVVEQFVRIKTRAAERLHIEMVRVDIPSSATTDEVIAQTSELSQQVDAIIVQLPLPSSVNTTAVLSAIPHEKDVDALNPTVKEDEHHVFAPVALAVAEILKRGGVDVKGKRAVIAGAGRLVGAPTGALLKKMGAYVSFFTIDEGSVDDLKVAEIAVLGVGKPGFIKPEHLKEGVALVDAGASESAGKVVGDADPACAEKCSVFTPVPGGVGPVAVAMIFKNLFDLVEK